MEEKSSFASPRRQYGKQPISVPFLWEEKPGTPKKDWTVLSKPDPFIGSPVVTAPSPVRLIISVPFQWEEEPGKPFQETSSEDDNASQHEDWYSISGTDCHSSSSSTATRNGSIDASALEFLFPFSSTDTVAVQDGVAFVFPLPPPRSGFLNKVYGPERSTAGSANLEMQRNECRSDDRKLTVKRQLTLGELILLSRKLSYRKEPAVMKRTKFSMDFIRKYLFECFALRTNCIKNTASIACS